MKFLAVLILFELFCSTWAGDVSPVFSRDMFNEMLKHRNDRACPGNGFYTYEAFMEAARFFPDFGTVENYRKRDLAAFFGQTSHETTGGTPGSPDQFEWGYCFIREGGNSGGGYYGRGPIQLTHRYNYELAGRAINEDLVNNPDLVATNPTIAFKTAIWFWMTPQNNKPSCHAVITRKWNPTPGDLAAGRYGGYGVITNIINGGVECGKGPQDSVRDRIGYYKRYCQMFQLNLDDNLDCKDQRPFNIL